MYAFRIPAAKSLSGCRRHSLQQIFRHLLNILLTVDLGQLPENVSLLEYVPQLELLPFADVFVTHGGWNSVNEALFHDVPMVVCPQGKDQFLNARVIDELGAGRALADLSSDKLRAAVDAVRMDRRFRQRASELGATLRAAGGAARAADEIIRLLNN